MGLSHRCEILVKDYRDIPELGEFDKIASVGMVEHVGRDQLPCYFDAAYRALRPGGHFLNHGIVCSPAETVGRRAWFREHLWREGEFVERYIFPDGELHPFGSTTPSPCTTGCVTSKPPMIRPPTSSVRPRTAPGGSGWLAPLRASLPAASG